MAIAIKKSQEKNETNEKETIAKGSYFYANGKRKTSIARVKLYKGTGKIVINNRDIKAYLPIQALVEKLKHPLQITGSQKNFDIEIAVEGGGISSQSQAARHGISKALIEADLLNKPVLKKAGLLSRDSRVKERKKYGLKRARKAPQFSKR